MTILASELDSVRASAAPGRETPWQAELRCAVRDPAVLCELLDLPRDLLAAARESARQFPLFVPRSYVANMRRGDPHDPLLRQVLPLLAEQLATAGFSPDPVAEADARRAPGLLHKYPGRALLVTTGACAVHCRYCFRRHYPYSEGPRSLAEWEPAFGHLAADASLHEIILSGGDPLTLRDGFLAQLAQRLAEIGHLRRLRVHTRLPIVLPSRVCDALVAWLTGTRLQPIVVVHANHPAELGPDVARAVSRLAEAGITLLNQAVLLRGVNDSADVLAELCQRLVDLRVMPYYLHQLDPVAGAAHFAVPQSAGRRLMRSLRSRLPGYAVPRYVCERPGALGKTPLG